MNAIGGALFLLLLVHASRGLPGRKTVNTVQENDIDNEHMRTKRGVLTAIKELGCLAFTAVKECTQDLNSCGHFCDIVHGICSVASVSSALTSQLCNDDVKEYEPIVMGDYSAYSHNNKRDAERLITKLGGDIEKNSSNWKKISRFFRNLWNKFLGLFQ